MRRSGFLQIPCWVALSLWILPYSNAQGPCPFKDGQSETRELWNATTLALQNLQNAGKNCRDSNGQALLAGPTDQLATHFQTLVENDDPKERELETQFGQVLNRVRSQQPLVGEQAQRYGHCTSGRSDPAQIEECLYLAYSVILNEHRSTQPGQSEREKRMSEAIRGLQNNLNLVASTMAVGSCRDNNTVKAAVGAAASLTAALAIVPGAGLIGIGVVASLDAIQALLNSLFGDQTLQRMLTEMNDRDTFENLACLQLEVQNQTLGCSQDSKPMASSLLGREIPAPRSGLRVRLAAVALDEIRIPDPRFSSSVDMPLGQYFEVLASDLRQEFQLLGEIPESELQASLPLEWQTLKELEKIQQAQAQNPKGFEQIRKSAEEMSRLFKDWPISESRDWDFVSDQSPFPLRAMMDFHFRILQQRGSQPGAQNFDWWVRSDRRIRSMQQNMGSLNGSDSDGATRLNILHTNLLTAMKPTVKERLKKALGTYRSNRSGQDGLGPVMDLLKLCTVGAGALHFASAEDARKVRSEGGTWASNTVLVDRDYSESCRELSCVLPERFSASVEVINPSTRAEADAVAANRRYVCALAKSYPDSLARLSREFKDHGTVCGQPFASALAPANSRPGHR